MKHLFSIPYGLVALLILSSVFLSTGCISQPLISSENNKTERFVKEVKPVLEYYCIQCHTNSAAPQYGGFSMETGLVAMTTGRHAPVIHPGKPDESLFYKVLRLGHEDVLAMPPSPDKITDKELAAVRDWIRSGATWPSGSDGHLHLPK